jgi:integrase
MRKRQATQRVHFTMKTIEAITPPAKGRVTVYDASVHELGLRVAPTGRRTFFWFRHVNGRPTFEFIGTFPVTSIEQARGKAREHSGALEKYRRNDFKGPNPFDHGTANTTSAESVAEEWLQRDVATTRTAYEVERILRREILPVCRGKAVSEITRADTLRMLDAIQDRGKPIAANRTLSIMKRWLNWCVDRGYLEASPVANIPAPAGEKSRDRVLADAELRDVWNAAGELSYPTGPFLRLLILTAQRRGEVAGMRWPDVDVERALWTLSADQTKAGRQHDVPLSTHAVEILRGLLPEADGGEQDGGEHIFSTTHGAKPINGFSKLKHALDAAILTLRKKAGDESPLARFTLHDIRRTASTHMAKSGVPPHVLSALLNHSPGGAQGVTAIYNRFRYVEERRAALEAWAETVLHIGEAVAKPKLLKAAMRRKVAARA